MKITGIDIHKVALPYVDGAYAWGAGNAIETAMASVVVLRTDAGLLGCGEFTPCGENYMVAHSEGVEAIDDARLVLIEVVHSLVTHFRDTRGGWSVDGEYVVFDSDDELTRFNELMERWNEAQGELIRLVEAVG